MQKENHLLSYLQRGHVRSLELQLVCWSCFDLCDDQNFVTTSSHQTQKPSPTWLVKVSPSVWAARLAKWWVSVRIFICKVSDDSISNCLKLILILWLPITIDKWQLAFHETSPMTSTIPLNIAFQLHGSPPLGSPGTCWYQKPIASCSRAYQHHCPAPLHILLDIPCLEIRIHGSQVGEFIPIYPEVISGSIK